MSDLKNLVENFDTWIKTENGQNFLNNKKKIIDIEIGRFEKFESWLELNDFDNLIYRLINEHDDNYREKCYSKGHEPHPNNKLNFIIKYIINNFEPVNVRKIKCNFPHTIWEFKGFYLEFVYGQGTMITIYNKDDLKPVLSL